MTGVKIGRLLKANGGEEFDERVDSIAMKVVDAFRFVRYDKPALAPEVLGCDTHWTSVCVAGP